MCLPSLRVTHVVNSEIHAIRLNRRGLKVKLCTENPETSNGTAQNFCLNGQRFLI